MKREIDYRWRLAELMAARGMHNSTDLSPRLPDGDRTWLMGGARWKYSQAINFDIAGGYIWVKDPTINNSGFPPSVAANGLINGTYDASVWIVSAQMNYRFR